MTTPKDPNPIDPERPWILAEFPASDVDFEPMYNAQAWIREQGWTVAPTQGGSPRGIFFDQVPHIAKWRNLNTGERAALDAVLLGRGRSGPLTITTEIPLR